MFCYFNGSESDIQLYFMLSLPPSLALSLSHTYTYTQVRTSYQRSIIFHLIVKFETVVLIKARGCWFFPRKDLLLMIVEIKRRFKGMVL